MRTVTRLALVLAGLVWAPLNAYADSAPACGNMASFDAKAMSKNPSEEKAAASHEKAKQKVADKTDTASSKTADAGKAVPSAQGHM